MELASVPLAKCATFRFFIFFVFYRPSRSLVLIGIGFRSTRQVRYIPIFYIFCILSTLTQFGFNWNLASVPLAKCAIPIFIRLAGSHQQFVQQYDTKKIKNQTNFYEKFQ